jgi:CheY-like chemotaxis protein/HPt (histidine-containing phosphotransfer) domain-containing protein
LPLGFEVTLEAKKYKILLVDDDYFSQRMMSLVLSAGGYLYDKAFNGAEALEAVQSQHFDLILMDLQMPIMDGYEAARRIRALEAGNGHIPIIALTAMIFHDENQLCLAAGMDGCIVKPFDTPELYQAIDSYVENSKNSGMAQLQYGMKLEDENSLLNIQAALPRFGNDIQTYQEFLLEFLQSLPERIEQIRTMFVSGDFQSLSKDSHNLKGVAASMGAMQISALAAKLEKQSRKGETRLIEETLDECDKIVLILENIAMKMLSKYPDIIDKID